MCRGFFIYLGAFFFFRNLQRFIHFFGLSSTVQLTLERTTCRLFLWCLASILIQPRGGDCRKVKLFIQLDFTLHSGQEEGFQCQKSTTRWQPFTFLLPTLPAPNKNVKQNPADEYCFCNITSNPRTAFDVQITDNRDVRETVETATQAVIVTHYVGWNCPYYNQAIFVDMTSRIDRC